MQTDTPVDRIKRKKERKKERQERKESFECRVARECIGHRLLHHKNVLWNQPSLMMHLLQCRFTWQQRLCLVLCITACSHPTPVRSARAVQGC